MISKRNCIQSDVWEKLKTLSTRSCFWRTLPLSPARSCTSTVARAPVTDQNGVAVLPPHTSSRWGRTTPSDPNAAVANLSPPVLVLEDQRDQGFLFQPGFPTPGIWVVLSCFAPLARNAPFL